MGSVRGIQKLVVRAGGGQDHLQDIGVIVSTTDLKPMAALDPATLGHLI